VGLALAAAALAANNLPRSSAQTPTTPPPASTQAPPTGGTIRGTVKAGTTPLPGVAVTATNTLTGKKFATTTDVNGNYAMTIPRTGRYVVKAELAAFATVTNEVRITAEAADQTAVFTLELASRAAAQQAASTSTTAQLAAALNRGTQSLSMSGSGEDLTDASAGGGNTGVSQPTLGGLGDSASTESVAVTGVGGSTNPLAGISQEDLQDRITNAIQQARQQGMISEDQAGAAAGMIISIMNGPGGMGGGGRGGAGGGRGGPGGGGGGGFRNFNPAQPHGSVFYQGGYGDLNALAYSLTGAPEQRLSNVQNRFGVSYTGSPYIPGILKANTKQFIFLNITGNRNINPQTFYATVPTLAERTGDFSGLTQNVSGVSTPITLYNPATPGVAFTNNTIPGPQLAQAALNLLKYYPDPNITPTLNSAYNYQTVTTSGSNSTQVSLRYVRNFGATPQFGPGGQGGQGGGRRGGGNQQNAPKALSQSINFNGSYTGSASDNRNVFVPLGGGSLSTGYSTVAGYTLGYGRLRNNASLTWNRSHSNAFNYFTNSAINPGFAAGIPIGTPAVYTNPFYYGIPSLSFTGFSGLSNSSPSNNINQTISFSDFVSYSHKKHNMRYGFDFRRVHNDLIGGTNVLGALTFSGCNTAAPTYNSSSGQYTSQCVASTTNSSTSSSSGNGFADFLLGLPQQATVQASGAKLYLRENVFDWYVQDDYRVISGVTLNFGLRYEYFGPYTEKNNRLTNLDHNADFSQVALVTPGQTGPVSGNKYNRSLVNADHDLYSPRFGLAWRPKFVKDTVVRTGYGINFNTTAYSSFATKMSDQPPFAVTQTNIANQQGCGTLTLSAAYNCSTATVQSNYGINPNYRIGHVQVYNLDIQHTFPAGIVFNVGYNGSRGGSLDVLRAPNRTPSGLLNPNVQAFTYEDSQAFSRQNSLAVNARKRMQKGVALQATYTYGHSIDDASSIGGGGNTVAQNDLNLRAEESNSSFDIRQSLSGNFVYELPFGPNRAFLASGGPVSKIFDGFNLSGTFSFATGGYFTPSYSNTAAETATGSNGTLRPDRNFAVPIAGPKTVREWFNPAAFTAPAANSYGTASRYSIQGPGTINFNAALARNFSFGGTRGLETRMSATNAFNTVRYAGIDTTENDPTFGEVRSTGAMRSLTFLARYRF
jgi:hypothetical protein